MDADEAALVGRYGRGIAEQGCPAFVPPDQAPVGGEDAYGGFAEAPQHPLHAGWYVVDDQSLLRRLEAGEPVEVIALLIA